MKRTNTYHKKETFIHGVKRSWRLYVLLSATLIYLLIFHYIPLYGIQIAFRDYVPTKGFLGSNWVGLKHFKNFFSSVQFSTLIRNTLLLNIYSLIFSFPVPILLALLLNEAGNIHLKKIIQNLTYAPHFISTVVLCGMVISFTSPTTGVINSLIKVLGGNPVDFMGKIGWFRPIYILSGIWQNAGWSSIIYLAALSGIDVQLHEAAQIDGASRLQRVIHINIPGIMPTIVILFILAFGSMMSVGFEKVYLLQNSLNLPISEVISTYTYNIGILGAQFSYSSAIGLFNSIINCFLLLIVNKIAKLVGEISLF